MQTRNIHRRLFVKCSRSKVGSGAGDKAQFTCEICQNTFANVSELEAHLRVHSDVETFTCSVCEKQITQRNNFVRHSQKQVGGRQFSCGVCGKASYRSDLVHHIRSYDQQSSGRISNEAVTTSPGQPDQIHGGAESPSCDQRGKDLSPVSTLDAQKRSHPDKPETPSRGRITHALFSDQLAAVRENSQQPVTETARTRNSHHPVSEARSYPCSVCSDVYATYSELEVHLHVHRREDTIACNVCGKRIRRCNNFIRHMRVHYSVPMFSCGVCGLRCHHACDAKKHMMVHTNERPFACDDCGKTFVRASNLHMHQRSHQTSSTSH